AVGEDIEKLRQGVVIGFGFLIEIGQEAISLGEPARDRIVGRPKLQAGDAFASESQRRQPFATRLGGVKNRDAAPLRQLIEQFAGALSGSVEAVAAARHVTHAVARIESQHSGHGPLAKDIEAATKDLRARERQANAKDEEKA